MASPVVSGVSSAGIGQYYSQRNFVIPPLPASKTNDDLYTSLLQMNTTLQQLVQSLINDCGITDPSEAQAQINAYSPGAFQLLKNSTRIILQAKEDIPMGYACHITTVGSNAFSSAELAIASAGSTKFAMCFQNKYPVLPAGSFGTFYTKGLVGIAAGAAGMAMYLSDTVAGTPSPTRPAGAGKFIQCTGYTISPVLGIYDFSGTYVQL